MWDVLSKLRRKKLPIRAAYYGNTFKPGSYIMWPDGSTFPALTDLWPADTKGMKFDDGKSRVDLIDADWLEDVGRVMGHGAAKYSQHNWRLGIAVSRLLASCFRHLLAILRGEDNDVESGFPHSAHIGCNAMFLHWMIKHRKDLDDRYKGSCPYWISTSCDLSDLSSSKYKTEYLRIFGDMPYIKQERRDELLEHGSHSPQTAGELNFMFSYMINQYILNGYNYQTLNDVVGALEGAKLEFVRRIVNPYEDAKIKENGDVY